MVATDKRLPCVGAAAPTLLAPPCLLSRRGLGGKGVVRLHGGTSSKSAAVAAWGGGRGGGASEWMCRVARADYSLGQVVRGIDDALHEWDFPHVRAKAVALVDGAWDAVGVREACCVEQGADLVDLGCVLSKAIDIRRIVSRIATVFRIDTRCAQTPVFSLRVVRCVVLGVASELRKAVVCEKDGLRAYRGHNDRSAKLGLSHRNDDPEAHELPAALGRTVVVDDSEIRANLHSPTRNGNGVLRRGRDTLDELLLLLGDSGGLARHIVSRRRRGGERTPSEASRNENETWVDRELGGQATNRDTLRPHGGAVGEVDLGLLLGGTVIFLWCARSTSLLFRLSFCRLALRH